MEESDIAGFRREQSLHEEAARRGLYGPAIVGSHAVIEARMAQHAKPITRHIRHLLAQGKRDEAGRLIQSHRLWG